MSEFRNVYVNYKGPSHYENMWAICNRGISIQFTVSFFHFSWAMPKTIACQILNRQERHIDNIFCLLSFEKSVLSNNQSIINSLKGNWMFDMKLLLNKKHLFVILIIRRSSYKHQIRYILFIRIYASGDFLTVTIN